jgi:hypothetical protein
MPFRLQCNKIYFSNVVFHYTCNITQKHRSKKVYVYI